MLSERQAREQIEVHEKWLEIAEAMPFLRFRPEWQVQIIPPYHGAVARFVVNMFDGCYVSVYLDWYDRLGVEGTPYWEICPAHDGDVARFLFNDTETMMDAIATSLARQATLPKEKA